MPPSEPRVATDTHAWSLFHEEGFSDETWPRCLQTSQPDVSSEDLFCQLSVISRLEADRAVELSETSATLREGCCTGSDLLEAAMKWKNLSLNTPAWEACV